MEKIVSAEDLNKLPHRYQVMFAIFCTEQVVDLVREQDREVYVKALDTSKRWLRGEVSEEECRVAGDYAYARTAGCAACAAIYAANAASTATYAAIYAANTARAARAGVYAGKNETSLVKEQWDYYYELLNLDSNLEKILVG
jgi:hypothetical protein